MVKNTTGGSKQKSQARKFSNSSVIKQTSKLRMVENDGEMYGQVTSLLGNGMCYVQCEDNVKLCIIRGKFRGRGKKDNMLKKGSWVLVGVREWENSTSDKKAPQKCDLLEVYSDYDKDRLKVLPGPFKIFIANDNIFNNHDAEDGIDFSDSTNEEYKQLMSQEIKSGSSIRMMKIQEDEQEVEIDDI